MYNTLAIVGSQWGDEGKGKLTDYFAQGSDVVIRWSGGDNAGHTIKFDDQTIKLSMLPSGIINNKCLNIITSGCVINLEKLASEIIYCESRGISLEGLRVSDRAHLVLRYHLKLDECQELMRSKTGDGIGTTKRGIGPAYQDKVERIGLRICDLANEALFLKKLEKILTLKNRVLERIYKSLRINDIKEIFENCIKWYEIIKPYVCDTGRLIEEKIVKENKKVLLEGAQGVMLDLDYGTYPYVTSSTPASIGAGLGVSSRLIENVLGVAKAYTTRVGEGAFPTEIEDNHLSETIRIKGREYGTVSMRPRRIGWFDAVAFNHSRRVAGYTHLAITLLDVLSVVDEIKICIKYKLNDQIIDYVPASIEEYKKCEAQYVTMPGWGTELTGITRYEDLPLNAKNYLNKISELTNVKLGLVSVGANRNETIVLDNILKKFLLPIENLEKRK